MELSYIYWRYGCTGSSRLRWAIAAYKPGELAGFFLPGVAPFE